MNTKLDLPGPCLDANAAALCCPRYSPLTDAPPRLIAMMAEVAEHMSAWMSGAVLPVMKAAAYRRK